MRSTISGIIYGMEQQQSSQQDQLHFKAILVENREEKNILIT